MCYDIVTHNCNNFVNLATGVYMKREGINCNSIESVI